MIQIGKKQMLEIVSKTSFGVYLSEKNEKDGKVLLPSRQVPGEAQIGDLLEVFIYRDSSDRIIATVLFWEKRQGCR